jgi:hypothetical protein
MVAGHNNTEQKSRNPRDGLTRMGGLTTIGKL